ncbi:hypothetical protein [Streptomyces goshikiensis]|uniref:hypothetical protein n=1 Tax=Streptomyces goshikiensis TaxID=1942 RepID=UPI00367F8100
MTGRPCDVPGDVHDGQPRLYPCGWRCTSHAPQTRPALTPTTSAPAATRRQTPQPTRWQVIRALFIDCGQGIEIKTGDRAGQIWWKTPPRARHECLDCGWQSETVTGPAKVKAFISHIRDTHQATCTGAVTEGARAA